jgi:hypothetical protein
MARVTVTDTDGATGSAELEITLTKKKWCERSGRRPSSTGGSRAVDLEPHQRRAVGVATAMCTQLFGQLPERDRPLPSLLLSL